MEKKLLALNNTHRISLESTGSETNISHVEETHAVLTPEGFQVLAGFSCQVTDEYPQVNKLF